ncbi:MAG: lysophospholipid acyltransferase family protein [Hylemonella sp.]|nr:lysophospholipid acyltransferase family protein [Hylemonella sp.]
MITLFRFLSRLPLWLLHALGWGVGWGVFLASASYRQRFLANVRQAGIGRRQWMAAVGQAGMALVEWSRLWLGRPVRIEWEGAEHVAHALDQGRGIVFLTPHLGGFEITGQAYAQRFGARQPVTALFRPSRQPWLRELVAAARSRPGLKQVPTTVAGVKQMIKALRQGQAVGLLPDQVPPQGMGVWAPFFGKPAYTMTLSARLVQQTGALVVLVWGERLSWGRGYRMHARPLGVEMPAEIEAATAVVNQAMERVIAECPHQYLWGYARYKQPRQEAV